MFNWVNTLLQLQLYLLTLVLQRNMTFGAILNILYTPNEYQKTLKNNLIDGKK